MAATGHRVTPVTSITEALTRQRARLLEAGVELPPRALPYPVPTASSCASRPTGGQSPFQKNGRRAEELAGIVERIGWSAERAIPARAARSAVSDRELDLFEAWADSMCDELRSKAGAAGPPDDVLFRVMFLGPDYVEALPDLGRVETWGLLGTKSARATYRAWRDRMSPAGSESDS
jgi:hypothetical protein